MRHIWAQTPLLLRRALPLVWQRVFGLTVLSADDPSPMRWPVRSVSERSIVMANESKLLEMTNEVHLADDSIEWRTTVDYRWPMGRALWTTARVGHELALPQAIRRGVATSLAV